MTKAHDKLLDAVSGYAGLIRMMAANRDAAIIAAVRGGCTQTAVAEAAGLTQARVSQIAPWPRAQEPKAEPAPAEVAGTRGQAQKMPTLAADAPLLSTFATTRVAPHYGRRVTAWVRIGPGAINIVTDGKVPETNAVTSRGTVADLLWSLPEDVARVYVMGPRSAVTDPAAATPADGVRAWFLGDLEGGWAVTDQGCHLADPDLPIGRYFNAHTSQTVEVHRGATWFDDEAATPRQAADAMALLSFLQRAAFGTGQWLSTPATTGRDLWRRSIPKDREWPVLSPELRELIQSTSGQGRNELLPPYAGEDWTGGPRQRTAPGFVYLDGRFMYAALTWGMPTGEPVWHTAAEVAQTFVPLEARGRWRARVTVPRTWAHVGLVPMMGAGLSWEYPREPGRRFETWADAAELRLAREQGWGVELLEGFTMTEGKPLDTWTRKLVTIREQVAGEAARLEYDPAAVPLVRGAIRGVLLKSLGAFAGRSHIVTRTGVYPGTGAVDGVRVVNGLEVWQEHGQAAWSESMAHPEWSAQVWARARARLLDAPTPRTDGLEVGQAPPRTGALHVPFADVIGFRTDALYLTADPGWPDDGRPGRFRVKGALGAVPWPRTLPELFALRDRATEGGPVVYAGMAS